MDGPPARRPTDSCPGPARTPHRDSVASTIRKGASSWRRSPGWPSPAPLSTDSCARRRRHASGRRRTHAYRAVDYTRTFVEAREVCRRLGAHLLTISSLEENSFVSSQLFGVKWLGAEAAQQPRDFRWVDGEPFEFRLYAPIEPDRITRAQLSRPRRGSHVARPRVRRPGRRPLRRGLRIRVNLDRRRRREVAAVTPRWRCSSRSRDRCQHPPRCAGGRQRGAWSEGPCSCSRRGRGGEYPGT